MPKKEWSNELQEQANEIDKEMMKPTPRELKLAAQAEKAKDAKPQTYNVTSKNAHALRVIHDYDGNQVALTPGEQKRNIRLLPNIAEYLGKLDLEVTEVEAA